MSDALVRPLGSEDWPAVERLLTGARLPIAGAREHAGLFRVAVNGDGATVGCIGIERHGDVGLLRSVVVQPADRRSGVGARLVSDALATARAEGFAALYLLTTDAEVYFGKFGFRSIPRAELPSELAASEQLRGACPTSATAMVLELNPIR